MRDEYTRRFKVLCNGNYPQHFSPVSACPSSKCLLNYLYVPGATQGPGLSALDMKD